MEFVSFRRNLISEVNKGRNKGESPLFNADSNYGFCCETYEKCQVWTERIVWFEMNSLSTYSNELTPQNQKRTQHPLLTNMAMLI